METNTKSKKDVQKFIKKELSAILTTVNPGLDKKDFKKSIKKASKILSKGIKKGKSNEATIELVKTPNT